MNSSVKVFIGAAASSILVSCVASNSNAEQIYFSQGRKIWRTGLDGSESVLIHEDPLQIREVRVHQGNRQLYWFGDIGRDFGLIRSDLNGENPEKIIEFASVGANDFQDFVIDEGRGHIYSSIFGPSIGATIIRMDLDGSNMQTILSLSAPRASSLAIDPEDGKIYWTVSDGDGKGVYSANLDGTEQTKLTVEPKRYFLLTLDRESDRLYASTFDSVDIRSRIEALDVDGGNLVDLILESDVTPVDSTYRHNVGTLTYNSVNNRLYWTSRTSGKDQIWSSDAGGGDIAQFRYDIGQTSGNVLGLDIHLIPEPSSIVLASLAAFTLLIVRGRQECRK